MVLHSPKRWLTQSQKMISTVAKDGQYSPKDVQHSPKRCSAQSRKMVNTVPKDG